MTLVEATESAITASTHLTPSDAGAVQAMRELARKIDAWDVVVGFALEDIEGVKGARPAVPQNDNVSLSAYLKYCDQLGLTPAGRKTLDMKKASGVGKLTAIRDAKRA